MKVLAFEAFLRDIAASIVEDKDVVLYDPRNARDSGRSKLLSEHLSLDPVSVDQIEAVNPDCILATLPEPDLLPRLREELFNLFNRQIFIHHHDPVRLDDIYAMYEDIGRELKNPQKGREIANRMKAQIMDWCSSFYDRIKNKRVTLLSSVQPLMLGGRWIPDMIRVASGTPQALLAQREDQLIRWDDVVKFNPDVIVVAPKNLTFNEGVKTFKYLSTLPKWDSIYAVKRGDVFFTDGQQFFNQPTSKLVGSMGVLISALAGFESGYITPRDVMYKLRYLELHRHKF